VVDTLERPETGFPDPPMIATQLLPFGARHIATWSPLGYFVTANTGRYAVDLRIGRPGASGAIAPSAPWRPGDPVRSIRVDGVTPVPVNDAERADWRQSLTMYLRSGRRSRWEWDGPEIPRVKPPIGDIDVSTDGRIWVRVSQPARLEPTVRIRTAPATGGEWNEIDAPRRWVESWVYDVFEPGGVYVGRVRFPDDRGQEHFARPPYAMLGDTVWGVVHDADGVPSVKRYRVRWGG
jgi:hypothetical protein